MGITMKKKYVFVVCLLLSITLLSMGITTLYVHLTKETKEGDFTVVTSFYPMYIATLNLTDNVEGVTLKNLSEPQTGCLHDFQLTPEDMRLLSTADVFVINGGGVESFLEEVAKAYPNLTIVTACEYVELLQDEEETNGHAWMEPGRYMDMQRNLQHRYYPVRKQRSTFFVWCWIRRCFSPRREVRVRIKERWMESRSVMCRFRMR